MNWDLVDPSGGNISHINDSVTFFYYDDLTIYRIPRLTDVFIIKSNKDDADTATLVSSKKNYMYYAYRKGTVFGLMCDSLSVLNPYKVSVDSFLTQRAFKNFPFYDTDRYRLIEIMKADNLTTAKFVPKVKSPTHSDTAFYYFDKSLKDVDYSFSRKLDSTMNSKVYKVRYLYNAVRNEEGTVVSPKREMIFHLKKTNRKLDKKFFEFARKVNTKIDSMQ